MRMYYDVIFLVEMVLVNLGMTVVMTILMEREFINVIEAGNHDLLDLYLTVGIPADTSDEFGTPALLIASKKGHYQVVKCLLAYGANVDATNHWGDFTALSFAASYGHVQVVDLLLSHGAIVVSRFGSAARLASNSGHDHIVDLINRHIASRKERYVRDCLCDTPVFADLIPSIASFL